jgi:catechol 2,3-dioxygenase-like lactoylglutathione lyase family enzyme
MNQMAEGITTVDESPGMKLYQACISSLDAVVSLRWYTDGLGMRRSRFADTDSDILPPSAKLKPGQVGLSEIQGIPGPVEIKTRANCLDQQGFFQMELFQYQTPKARPKRADWRPSDIGYSILSVHVDDFDSTLTRLAALGSRPLGPTLGEGGRRRVCVADPDGVLVEIMEDDPRTSEPIVRTFPEFGVAMRSVRLSVPDLGRSRRFFVDTLGMKPMGSDVLHGAEHEALWGLAGAKREVEVLAIGDMWLELVQYADPLGRPWPEDYRLCDQGVLNIGLGSRDKGDYERNRDAVGAAGYHLETPGPIEFLTCLYVLDDQGFSVELTYIAHEADEEFGFIPDPVTK